MAKGSSYPELTNPVGNDLLLGIDSVAVGTKNIKLSTVAAYVLKVAYPVGSLYTSTVSTNPATLLGFGTWSAFAQGQTLVGKAASGTFATAGATGGTENETLSIGQIPAHAHGVNDPGHSHSAQGTWIRDVGSGGSNTNTGAGSTWRNLQAIPIDASGTGISIQNAGGGGSHNNMPPYVVVYIWQRTA